MTISKLALALVGMAGLAAAQNVISVPVPMDRHQAGAARPGSPEFGKRLKGNLDNIARTREFLSLADVSRGHTVKFRVHTAAIAVNILVSGARKSSTPLTAYPAPKAITSRSDSRAPARSFLARCSHFAGQDATGASVSAAGGLRVAS